MRFLIGSATQADPDNRKKAITDTQTGMRGIGNRILKSYLTLAGERFEYETNMLIEALHTHTPVKEIGIQTVYIDENSGTHFRPLADSAAIYRQIFSTFFKYTLASLSSFLIDYGIYSLLILLLQVMPLAARIWIAAAAARILSSLYNYAVNRNIVFKSCPDQAHDGKILYPLHGTDLLQRAAGMAGLPVHFIFRSPSQAVCGHAAVFCKLFHTKELGIPDRNTHPQQRHAGRAKTRAAGRIMHRWKQYFVLECSCFR